MATSDCITIPLTKGYSTVIDLIDSDLANLKWNTKVTKTNHYARRKEKRVGKYQKTTLLHRVILSRILGRYLLPSEEVDHEDGDGLNNRRKNLRLATHAQNSQNKGKHRDNTTGYKGVYKHRNGYQAKIQVENKLYIVGSFDTPELAAIAYNEAAIKHHGDFAVINEIKDSD